MEERDWVKQNNIYVYFICMHEGEEKSKNGDRMNSGRANNALCMMERRELK